MQAISNDVTREADLAGLLHSQKLAAELASVDARVLAGSGVTGVVDDLDDAWFSAFDETIAIDDGFYEEPVPTLRPRAPLRIAFALGAAASAALVALAAM